METGTFENVPFTELKNAAMSFITAVIVVAV